MQRQDYDLQRFKNAQEQSYAGYQEALQEIKNGCKVGHWIWYIFPQVKGLGRSGMSDYYGLQGLQEAKAYMEDPLLREPPARDHNSASSGRGQECGRNPWRY